VCECVCVFVCVCVCVCKQSCKVGVAEWHMLHVTCAQGRWASQAAGAGGAGLTCDAGTMQASGAGITTQL